MFINDDNCITVTFLTLISVFYFWISFDNSETIKSCTQIRVELPRSQKYMGNQKECQREGPSKWNCQNQQCSRFLSDVETIAIFCSFVSETLRLVGAKWVTPRFTGISIMTFLLETILFPFSISASDFNAL